MRCQFCGWDNPQGKEKCEKCNKPLVSLEDGQPSSGVLNNHSRPTDRKASSFDPKATVREGENGAKSLKDGRCPKCNYPLENGKCASCGYEDSDTNEMHQKPKSVSLDPRKTVRPNRKGEKEGSFTLTPISETTGIQEGEVLSFDGNEVCLNRDNTDPKNSTITSVQQAIICREGGVWNIEDKSEYKTTFVQAIRKIELQKGDLILLGNQLYRFDA